MCDMYVPKQCPQEAQSGSSQPCRQRTWRITEKLFEGNRPQPRKDPTSDWKKPGKSVTSIERIPWSPCSHFRLLRRIARTYCLKRKGAIGTRLTDLGQSSSLIQFDDQWTSKSASLFDREDSIDRIKKRRGKPLIQSKCRNPSRKDNWNY